LFQSAKNFEIQSQFWKFARVEILDHHFLGGFLPSGRHNWLNCQANNQAKDQENGPEWKFVRSKSSLLNLHV
jgi:hypothetical protein